MVRLDLTTWQARVVRASLQQSVAYFQRMAQYDDLNVLQAAAYEDALKYAQQVLDKLPADLPLAIAPFLAEQFPGGVAPRPVHDLTTGRPLEPEAISEERAIDQRNLKQFLE